MPPVDTPGGPSSAGRLVCCIEASIIGTKTQDFGVRKSRTLPTGMTGQSQATAALKNPSAMARSIHRFRMRGRSRQACCSSTILMVGWIPRVYKPEPRYRLWPPFANRNEAITRQN